MKDFHIEKIIVHNRAPFEHLELNFSDNTINILSAVNGGGKTTIMSHIVDAFYELARSAFPGTFEGKENKYYRVSSTIYQLDFNAPSLFYMRCSVDGAARDYIDARMPEGADAFYEDAVKLDNKIDFKIINNIIKESNNVKYWSTSHRGKAQDLFANNIMTYFPAYRYEEPGFLNDLYQVNIKHQLSGKFTGTLSNPIEVITGLKELANWLMDLILDSKLEVKQQQLVPQTNQKIVLPTNTDITFNNMNRIISSILNGKGIENGHFGIGNRHMGGLRIQIVGNNQSSVYPSIFNMSSGESAALTLFGELLKQYDQIKPNSHIQEAKGVVLIDEIDKHMHIKLQKEVLPILFSFFPNIQFIISTHSPFVTLGLASSRVLKERTILFDLDNGGIERKVEEIDEYNLVYEMMISENDRYKDIYEEIAMNSSDKLQIITEGKNTEHIEHAISVLDNSLFERIEFVKGIEDRTGVSQLKAAYETMLSVKSPSKYLFIFDCDASEKVRNLVENERMQVFTFSQDDSPNKKIQRGIENLYPADFFTDELYTVEFAPTGVETKKPDKKKILAKVKNVHDKAFFELFQPLIDEIKTIVFSTDS